MRIASLELIGSGTPSSRSPMTSTPPQTASSMGDGMVALISASR